MLTAYCERSLTALDGSGGVVDVVTGSAVATCLGPSNTSAELADSRTGSRRATYRAGTE
jgi:hypothetical protein